MATKLAKRGLSREYSDSYMQLREDLQEMARRKEAAGINEFPFECQEKAKKVRRERKNHELQEEWLTRAWG